MQFSDPDMVERVLHNDLNTLIKNIKTRQQQYLKLLDWNRGIVNKLREINVDNTIIINDEVTKYRNLLNNLKSQHSDLIGEEVVISNKYKGVNINNESIIRLMGRVGARILEMFQSYYEKTKGLHHSSEQRYKKMRNAVMKSLNQKDKTDIAQFSAVVISYIHEKVNEQIVNLDNLIQILQQGQPQKYNEIYDRHMGKKSPQKKKQAQLSQQMKKQKDKMKEKLAKLKQQSKINQKIRKHKTKFANYMVTGLYSTMDLAKNHFLEDFVCSNPQQKYKKLYEEIYSRNKFNHQQILSFQAKTDEFHEKIKKFKQKMEDDSKKIQQALIFKSCPKKQTAFPAIDSNPLNQAIEAEHQKQENNSDIGPCQAQFLAIKINDNKFKQNEMRTNSTPNPNLNSNKGISPRKPKDQFPCYSMQATQEGFQHLKFDSRQQEIYLRSNRARLPQISGRAPNQNYENRQKSNKNQQRISIATNININGQSQKIRFSSKIQNFIQKNSIESKQKKKDSLPKSFQYTFYIKKRASKFYETRNQFII